MTVEAGEVFGFLGPERRRQDDDDPHAARPAAADQRRRPAVRARQPPRQRRDPRPPRQPARRVHRRAATQRARAHRPLRRAPRPARPRAGGRAGRALRGRPRAAAGELSRGNRQKVGLIQAAFHEPELLLLDEPTSGLDPLMQEEFLAFVAEERDAGRTVFLSSHELDEVERACDRVGIIREGPARRRRGRRRHHRPRLPPRHAGVRRARRPVRVRPAPGRDRGSSATGTA